MSLLTPLRAAGQWVPVQSPPSSKAEGRDTSSSLHLDSFKQLRTFQLRGNKSARSECVAAPVTPSLNPPPPKFSAAGSQTGSAEGGLAPGQSPALLASSLRSSHSEPDGPGSLMSSSLTSAEQTTPEGDATVGTLQEHPGPWERRECCRYTGLPWHEAPTPSSQTRSRGAREARATAKKSAGSAETPPALWPRNAG